MNITGTNIHICRFFGTLKFPVEGYQLKKLVKNDSLLQESSYIDGKAIAANDWYPIVDPATRKEILNMGIASEEDTKKAIQSAASQMTNKKWAGMSFKDRSNLMRKWSRLIRENEVDLGIILTMENGKPLKEARMEAISSANYIEFYSEECNRLEGSTIPSVLHTDRRQWTLKQPVGSVGLLTPWNFPSSVPARKLSPALAAGCSVVLKPSPETPLSALALAYLATEAGFPPGVFNVICTNEVKTPTIGHLMTKSPLLSKISFTGSTPIGTIIYSECASTIKRLSLELGGNAPLIIFEDSFTSPELCNNVLEGVMKSKFRASGQTCVCTNRIYVQEPIKEKFIDQLLKKVKSLKMGHGLDETTNIGPLLRKRDCERIKRWIDRAVSDGGKIIHGGYVQKDLGETFFTPTVITDLDPNSPICQEELFGPVVAIYNFKNEDEVLKYANNTNYGLASYIYTEDYRRMIRMSEGLQFGMVGINESLLSSVEIPFGGVKGSGFGKEGSSLAIEEYLNTKLVVLGNVH